MILKQLEDFVINNHDLEILESYFKKFNIFETLSSVNQELKHSNTLAFLMNPKEKHGLSDYFLKKFIIKTLCNNEYNKLSVIDVDNFDLSDSVIKREYKNIDILIENRDNSFICIIENKVFCSESKGQLSRYKNIINKDFVNYKHKLFIFLSPAGLEPSDLENWIISSYDIVAEILEDILEYKINSFNEEIYVFVSHYYEIIRRYLLENSKEVELAKKIYNTHKAALDFIFKNVTDYRQEIYDYIVELLRNKDEIILSHSTISRIRFTSKKLNDLLPNIGDGRWNKIINQVFLFEINNNSDFLSLIFVMGPTIDDYRKKAFDRLKKDFIPKYLKENVSLAQMYNTIYKKIIINKEEYPSLDIDTIKSNISNFFDDFINNDLIEITNYFEKNINDFK